MANLTAELNVFQMCSEDGTRYIHAKRSTKYISLKGLLNLNHISHN